MLKVHKIQLNDNSSNFKTKLRQAKTSHLGEIPIVEEVPFNEEESPKEQMDPFLASDSVDSLSSKDDPEDDVYS